LIEVKSTQEQKKIKLCDHYMESLVIPNIGATNWLAIHLTT